MSTKMEYLKTFFLIGLVSLSCTTANESCQIGERDPLYYFSLKFCNLLEIKKFTLAVNFFLFLRIFMRKLSLEESF